MFCSDVRLRIGAAITVAVMVMSVPLVAQGTGGTPHPGNGGGTPPPDDRGGAPPPDGGGVAPPPGDSAGAPPPGGGTGAPPPGDTSGAGTGGGAGAPPPGGDGGGGTGDAGGSGGSSSEEEFTANEGATISTSAATGTHTVWLGTGEYSMNDDWHGVLRFDNAQSISGVTTPNGTVNHRSSTNASGNTLDFGHDLYVTDDDNLYIAYTFSNEDGGEGCNVMPGTTENICGSIGVMSGAASLDGSQILTRQIYGENTGLYDPHGLWVDESRDILYVANAWAAAVAIWDNASTQNGDVAQTRTLNVSSEGYPVDVMLDADNDRLFVAFANDEDGSIGIFENASTLNGTVSPDHRIKGSNTRISEGNNTTTHNSVLIPGANLLVVGHHTSEVLIFDLNLVTFGATESTVDYDLTPRVLYINESTSDTWDWSCYGMAYASDGDELYVSAGYTPGGTATSSSSPDRNGSPEHAIKIFPNISDAGTSGFAAYREINWDNATQYFPPQPLWIEQN